MFCHFVLPPQMLILFLILERTNVVGVRFENMLFGNYWHGGAAKIQ